MQKTKFGVTYIGNWKEFKASGEGVLLDPFDSIIAEGIFINDWV